MKKAFLLIAIFLVVATLLSNAQTIDTAKLKATIDSLQKEIVKIKADNSSPNLYSDTTRTSGFVMMNKEGHFLYAARNVNIGQIILILLPVLFFGFILLYVLRRLKKEEYKLSDMLSENSTLEIDVDNPQAKDTSGNAVAGQPPFVKKAITPRSTSRLAAFLSGLAAVAIGVCTTSYYFYIYLKTNQAPNLDGLFNILLALGIGVVPYSVNKITSAFKS